MQRVEAAFDLRRESLNSYTFDSNLNGVPMCLSTDRLAADRVLPGEWTKVRSRPNLTQCVDTGRENGCGDF